MCARPNTEVDDPRICPACTEATLWLVALPCKRVMVAMARDDFLAAKGVSGLGHTYDWTTTRWISGAVA